MRHQRRGAREDPLADDGVALHERPLLWVERAGLEEDRVGDRGLPDVVQLGGEHDTLDFVVVEAKVTGGALGQRGDVVDVDPKHVVALFEHPLENLL
jgi:hypothetical protein